MALKVPDIIKMVFRDYVDIPCWSFSSNKVPSQLKDPQYNLSWKTNPDLGLITLDEIERWLPLHDRSRSGFGIFTGRFEGCKYGLGCLDFDHFLDKATGEPDYGNKLDKLLERMPTFAEKSVSDEGVHGFFRYDKSDPNTQGSKNIDIKKMGIILENFLSEEEIRLISLSKDDPERIEKGIKKYMPGGAIYTDMHFINMTGNVYKNNDNALCILNRDDFSALLATVTTQTALPVIKRPTYQSSFSRSWSDILCEAGIPHVQATDYIDKSPHGKLQIEAWKIPCPNRKNHQSKRPGDVSADRAILIRYSDDTSACTCKHNSCHPSKRPNLLKKLWDEIKEPKRKSGEEYLKKMGIIGQSEEAQNKEEKIKSGEEFLKKIGVLS